MDSLEQRVARNGKAYVIESIKTRIRFHQKRKVTILQTIATCEQRLDEIEANIKGYEVELEQLGEKVIDLRGI